MDFAVVGYFCFVEVEINCFSPSFPFLTEGERDIGKFHVEYVCFSGRIYSGLTKHKANISSVF